MAKLYQRLQKKNVTFSHICEVGVFEPQASNILEFIRQRIRATLIEADPDLASSIVDYFKDYPVTVHPVAVWDYAGPQTLAKANASSFVIALQSTPALVNDNYQLNLDNTFARESIVFSSIDPGDIDLISIDIEGGEWYVLKHMLSRPKVISVETHGKNYVNPFIHEITGWMAQHGYSLWYKDNTDSVYIQAGLFELTRLDRLALMYKNLRIALRRKKGTLLKYVRVR